MKALDRLMQILAAAETKICGFLLVVMCIVVLVQVFCRYLLSYSFVWAEELVRYLMIWMVMLGAALVQSGNDHIRIDFFPMLAGPRLRRAMETVFGLCTLALMAILVVKGVKAVYFNRMFESSGLRIPMFWPTLAIPAGALLMGMYTLRSLVRNLYQLVCWSSEKLREEDRRLAAEKYNP